MVSFSRNLMYYKVESGIELSPRNGGRWSDLIRQMKPGDSILVETFLQAQALSSALRKKGIKPSTRKQDGLGYRVWIIK